jgi:hypothetical protein
MHSYYHLLPLVCCYCSVGYLPNSVDYLPKSFSKFLAAQVSVRVLDSLNLNLHNFLICSDV